MHSPSLLTREVIKLKEIEKVPIHLKYALTIDEASEYFGIGTSKLRSLIQNNPYQDFYFRIGTKIMIKREMFEDYLSSVSDL